MEYRDYYKTLGVERGADEKSIRKAYRDLARKYHPDVNPNNKESEAKFREINEAYEVLSDADKRAKYDQLGSNYQQFARNGNGAGGFDWSNWASNPGGAGDEGDLSDFFTTMFTNGRAGGRTRAPIRGKDVEQPIEVTLEEAFAGTLRILKQGEKTTKIRIPAGAREGTKIRVAGSGEGGFAGGQTGDLYLIVSLKPHQTFHLRENNQDLEMDLKVDLYTAMLGGDVTVPTLNGEVKLRIPEGTQSGRMMRVAKRGMPMLNQPEVTGDLYVRVLIQVPTILSPEEREGFEKLRALREPKE